MARAIFILLIAFLLICFYLFFRGDQTPTNASSTFETISVAPKEANGFANWILYSQKDGKFRVYFPTLPQYASQNIKDSKTQQLRNYEMYIAEKGDGTSFMVNTITYPSDADLSDKQKVFREFVRELLASNPNNEVKKSTPSKFHNHEALDFEMNNGSAQMDSKLFLVGHTLVALSKLSPNLTDPDEDFRFFVNSFELLDSLQKIQATQEELKETQ